MSVFVCVRERESERQSMHVPSPPLQPKITRRACCVHILRFATQAMQLRLQISVIYSYLSPDVRIHGCKSQPIINHTGFSYSSIAVIILLALNNIIVRQILQLTLSDKSSEIELMYSLFSSRYIEHYRQGMITRAE